MKILILGGYGTFGGRLARLLADDQRLTLLLAGRSLHKAEAYCKELPGGAQKIGLVFDREGDLAIQLRQAAPDLVVDASGPFQDYGVDPYRVVRACIAAGIDYLDLADGSDFVKGIGRFDEAAKAGKVLVLSGVSSFPVLTAAVVRRLSPGLKRIDSIRGGIAPSAYAGVGLNVIRAIASYAGKRLALVRAGKPAFGYALTETMRYTVCPPGRLPLPHVLFSLVDVPDLQVLPDLWPEIDSLWMGAGPVPEILHRMLIGMAWLVRLRLLPTLRPFAPLFHFVINILRWGDHRGGMFVHIEGTDAHGEKLERSWHLLAEGDDGPLIPSMACEAVIRRCLAGKKPAPGARPATLDLELEDYEALFSRRAIHTGRWERRAGTASMPLYQRLLGEAWEALPPQLQALHAGNVRKAEGIGQVERGGNPLAQLAATLFGFPAAGKDIPVQVSFEARDGGEHWQRTFAGKPFSSFQSEGRGRAERLLLERFGPLTFGLALVAAPGRLSLVVRRWSILGIALPVAWAPRSTSYEDVIDGRFCFHVEIGHWLTGPIVRYQGWLAPA